MKIYANIPAKFVEEFDAQKVIAYVSGVVD
jgi:hypothetical protein